jgi:hypothetical protein
MRNIHPLVIILLGFFIASVGFNILFYKENQKLTEQIKIKPKVIIMLVPDHVPRDFT